MDTNTEIISDLNHKVGYHQPVEFLSDWKGVPVMVRGLLQEVRSEHVVFKVEPPDSICFAQQEQALLLHNVCFL